MVGEHFENYRCQMSKNHQIVQMISRITNIARRTENPDPAQYLNPGLPYSSDANLAPPHQKRGNPIPHNISIPDSRTVLTSIPYPRTKKGPIPYPRTHIPPLKPVRYNRKEKSKYKHKIKNFLQGLTDLLSCPIFDWDSEMKKYCNCLQGKRSWYWRDPRSIGTNKDKFKLM